MTDVSEVFEGWHIQKYQKRVSLCALKKKYFKGLEHDTGVIDFSIAFELDLHKKYNVT